MFVGSLFWLYFVFVSCRPNKNYIDLHASHSPNIHQQCSQTCLTMLKWSSQPVYSGQRWITCGSTPSERQDKQHWWMRRGRRGGQGLGTNGSSLPEAQVKGIIYTLPEAANSTRDKSRKVLFTKFAQHICTFCITKHRWYKSCTWSSVFEWRLFVISLVT